MIAFSDPQLLDRWRRRMTGRQRRTQPRPLAALGYLINGPLSGGLVEIENLVLVALYDDPADQGRLSLRMAGFAGTRIPWGVAWGGPDQGRFFKDVLLEPSLGARGPRLDASHENLLSLALQLDRELDGRARCWRRFARRKVRLPPLWAGFRRGDAAAVTGDGPELEEACRQTDRTAADLFKEARREFYGLVLYPLEWTSHAWPKAAAIFADLTDFPKRQVFSLQDLPGDLEGCRAAAQYDFFHSRFRATRAARCRSGRRCAAGLVTQQ